MDTDPIFNSLPAFAKVMKRDWNARALENAKWFINTISVDQSDQDFFDSGKKELQKWWLPDFREAFYGQDLKRLRVFEIGCGIGRMTCHLAEIFGEVWAVDVSGEMIRQGRERFSHLTNITWIETDGVGLDELPDDYFDLGFSIYVYQHVPVKEVISCNVSKAYHKIKPGGFYKFHTNGLVRTEYEHIEKDTWVGETFTESDIRTLALSINAQLISMSGSGTQYCWSTFRKPREKQPQPLSLSSIHIEIVGLAEDLSVPFIPVTGNAAMSGLVVSHLDKEIADCNNVRIKINGQPASPHFVGSLHEHHREYVSTQVDIHLDDLTYIETNIPKGVGTGAVSVCMALGDGDYSRPATVTLTQGTKKPPKIVTVRNGVDYGTDIYSSGPKSVLNLYVQDLDESATVGNISLQLNEHHFAPDFVGFVPENGTWQVNAALPEIVPGTFDLSLRFRDVESEIIKIIIK